VLIDTHCHIDITESFGIDKKEILENCEKNEISALIQIAVDKNSSLWNQNFVEEYNRNSNYKTRIFFTCGIHPESVQNRDQLKEIEEVILKCYENPYFVGIGETGLDFFQTPETKELQAEFFYKHLQLAKRLELPVIIHCRDDKMYNENKLEAIKLVYSIGKELNYPKAIMHCYTYSSQEAKWFIELGWKISFSGILTFKNATIIQDAAKNIPIENILIETDSPFLTPVPYRNKTNQPAFVKYVYDYLRQLLNIPDDILKEKLIQNALEVFDRIKLKS
jgi:TatD DNase family protein